MAETNYNKDGLLEAKQMYYGSSNSRGKAYYRMGVRDTAHREASRYFSNKADGISMNAEDRKRIFSACEKSAYLEFKNTDIQELYIVPVQMFVIGELTTERLAEMFEKMYGGTSGNKYFTPEERAQYILGAFGDEVRKALHDNSRAEIEELVGIVNTVLTNITDAMDHYITNIEKYQYKHNKGAEHCIEEEKAVEYLATASAYYNLISELLEEKLNGSKVTATEKQNKTSSKPAQPTPKPVDPREEKLHKLKDVEYYFKHGKELSDKEKRDIIEKAGSNMEIKADQYNDILKANKTADAAFLGSFFDTAETEMMLEDNPTAFSNSVFMLGVVLANEKSKKLFGNLKYMYNIARAKAEGASWDKGKFIAGIAVSIIAATLFAFITFNPAVTAFFTGDGFKGAVSIVVVVMTIVVGALCLGYGGLFLCAIGTGAFLFVAYLLTVLIEIGLVIKWIISIGAAAAAAVGIYTCVTDYMKHKRNAKKEKLQAVNELARCREYIGRCVEFIDKYETVVKKAVKDNAYNDDDYLKDVIKMVPDVRGYYEKAIKDLDSLYESTR